jgi:hypothetical protein
MVEFYPGWSARELLDALVYQPDQKKRRLILLLLEVWGAEARPLVVERLANAVAQRRDDENVWWYLRNLVFLLHKLPRDANADPRAELTLVAPYRLQPPVVPARGVVFLAGLPGGQRFHAGQRRPRSSARWRVRRRPTIRTRSGRS